MLKLAPRNIRHVMTLVKRFPSIVMVVFLYSVAQRIFWSACIIPTWMSNWLWKQEAKKIQAEDVETGRIYFIQDGSNYVMGKNLT